MPPTPTRRELLGASVALTGGLAGCGALDGGREALSLCALELTNEDSRAHTVHLRFEADGERVHEAGYEVPAADGDTVGDLEVDPRDVVSGPVESLDVWGRVGDDEWRGPAEYDATRVPDGRLDMRAHVEEDATLDVLHSAWSPDCGAETGAGDASAQ